ncbi:MAG: AmmeMemoRadiSam system protein B, partial [Candidatus Omnitrophica bacterium]|nr:AmmeMemoRadiSam system protein B [Candidatus Omnitrophota bacterium]
KKADLAGTWYPGSKRALSSSLEKYLKEADPKKIDGRIFAILSPHAGYEFSAPVAAYGFKAAQNQDVKTVILIGFSHRQYFDGISVYNQGAFSTPLGDIRVDEKLADDIISRNPRISYNPALFKDENSVEMQIPFIQYVFKDAKIVPIAFGNQSYGDAVILADALAAALKDREDYLIVASTDMSHFHRYEEANEIDRRAIKLLEEVKAKELYDEAQLGICELCGIMPITATLLAAEKMGYDKVEILKYANSGDTYPMGGRSRVVGYLSAAIYKDGFQSSAVSFQQKEERKKESDMLNDTQKKRLLLIARESITSFVKDGKRMQFTEKDPILNEPMGAFVTLHENGELRGCIGNMIGKGPLYQTVASMAIEAATGDPRFSRLTPQEIDKIDIEISVLSPLKKVSNYTEVKIPGHGVLVRRGFMSGVYLPQVADETGWNRDEFLTSLCGHKAGLAPDAWKDPATEIYVFSAEVFGEKGK